MTSVRLLVAAAFLVSPVLFAQDTAPNKSQASDNSNLASTTQNQPLIIDRLVPMWGTVPQNPLLRFETTEPSTFGQKQPSDTALLNAQDVGPFAIPPDVFADRYCLKIRSYQVARDSKNSDSTHLVGYSTCLPASRYRLRTAAGSTQPALSH